MTFQHYQAIMAKRWKLVAACLLIATIGAFVVSKLMTPIYSSSVLVQITISSSTDYTGLLASDQLVQTESQLALSYLVLNEVASHYHGLSAQQLARDVSSSPKLNTQLFEISVQNPDPQRAADLANDIANTLIRQQVQAMQHYNQDAQQQIRHDLDQTNQQIDATINQIGALRDKDPTRNAILQSRLNALQQHYVQWQTTLAQLELSQSQNGDFLRIAQFAQPTLTPVRPNILLNTSLGLLAGLFLGITGAILFEELDTSIRNADELTALLGWPVLGTIWQANTASRSKEKEHVVNPRGREANVEAYRILRTNIGFSRIDKPARLMLVTSAIPGEGKSTVAANLAIFMAKAGKNTLLIDADLRRPTLHAVFSLAADKLGLSNAVLALSSASKRTAQLSIPGLPSTNGSEPGKEAPFSLEPFFHHVGISNLRVMPSGPLPPNSSELLDSKAMQRLLSLLTNCGADIVIFDSSPIYGLSDASILASKVDGTLLVVDVSQANKGRLKQVKDLLNQAGAHTLGCIINKQRRRRHDVSSYYYYYRESSHEEGHTPSAPTQHDTSPSLSSSSSPAVVSLSLPMKKSESYTRRARGSSEENGSLS